MDDTILFAFFANALGGWGEDKDQTFPFSDAEDLSRGLRFIPGEVTVARRKGERVFFQQGCSHPCCWYWQFPDGDRIYYFDRTDYEQIGRTNGKELNEQTRGFDGGAGPCPDCGNVNTSGRHVKATTK